MVETYVATELQRQTVIVLWVAVTIETDMEERMCKPWWWLSSEPVPGNMIYYKLKCMNDMLNVEILFIYTGTIDFMYE